MYQFISILHSLTEIYNLKYSFKTIFKIQNSSSN